MSSAAQRSELQSQIWKIANEVRGSVDGWDFKQYVLGTLFYRFISENFSNYIEGGDDSINYAELDDSIITKEIKEAYRKMMEAKDDSVTDDGMVMETYGIRGVRMIKGSYENIKITTPEDMLLGEAILKKQKAESVTTGDRKR